MSLTINVEAVISRDCAFLSHMVGNRKALKSMSGVVDQESCSHDRNGERLISAIKIRAGTYVDQICINYHDGSSKIYGKEANSLQTVVLSFETGEYLRQIRIKQDTCNLQEIRFFTNRRASTSFGKGEPNLSWVIMNGTDSEPIVDFVSSDQTSPRIGGVLR